MKQWRRPQRAALRAHPVPIHANETAHKRAVSARGSRQKFVDTPRAIGRTHQKMMLVGWRNQSLDLAAATRVLGGLSVILRSPTTASTTFGRQLA